MAEGDNQNMANNENDEGVSIGNGKVVRDTGRALLIQLETGDERWIPSSVIHDDSPVYDSRDNSEGDVVVKRWFAEKEGLA